MVMSLAPFFGPPCIFCNYQSLCVLFIAVGLPSVLWFCWLGIRKSIWPVKIKWWGVGVVICLEWAADCLHMVHLMPLHPQTPSSLASFKSRLVLPFRYWLTQVILERRPLNGCSSSSNMYNSWFGLLCVSFSTCVCQDPNFWMKWPLTYQYGNVWHAAWPGCCPG